MMKQLFLKSWGVIILGLLLLQASPAGAQYYFGKNKVQYTKFDWHVMTTAHFQIYFYAEEADLAEIAARSAEEAYQVLASKFNHEIYSHIPLIIYSHPNHFVQTNITWSMLPENVAGFTEFIKGRVVVPFNGSYHDFDRVIRHELVHVFTISKISRTESENGRLSGAFPPLWFTEGLAEFWSRPWSSDADLIVRDMVINGTLPSIDNLWTVHGTYYMYKLGESICNFISDEYGSDKLTRLFENWTMKGRFEEILAYTLGEDIKKISNKWSYYLKKKYFPQIADYDLPDHDAVRLTRRQFAVRPVPIQLENERGEMEDWVIYKANRVGYSAIYMMPASGDNKRAVTLLKGERSARFESLHLLTSGVDQFDNRLLAFSSKSKERDVLYIYSIVDRKVTRRYEFPYLAGIASPRFSPDGARLVFTGNRMSGYADLYILDFRTGEVKRLTDDIYNDLDPSFGYDGQSILFSSDRGEDGYDGYLSLYRLDIASGFLERLTYGRHRDRSPSESPDGTHIIFSSDRGYIQAFNIFRLDREGRLCRVTEYITGAFDPRFGSAPGEIYFSAYQNRGFHVFKASPERATPMASQDAPGYTSKWLPGRIDARTGAAAIKYQSDYSLDIAQSTVAYDGVFGTIGGVQAAASDVLGNNTFIFLLSNTARDKNDIFTSFNVGVNYLRRTSRLNWGVGAYHFYNEFYNDFDGYYFERLIGGAVFAAYPISKFDRIESSLFIRHSDKDIFRGIRSRRAILLTQLFSLVTDNSLWEPTGPLEGHRVNLTVGHTYDLKSGRNFSRQASIDIRHYQRLRLFSAFASRFFAYTSTGVEPQRIYFGGSWSFRGFGRRHFYNRNVLFNSEELRFPLINNLVLAFPVGTFHLRGIRGAFFHDAGTAWDDRWRGWQGSFGASVRIALGYLVVLRFDFSRTHDFKTVSDHTRTDFFFGWNF